MCDVFRSQNTDVEEGISRDELPGADWNQTVKALGLLRSLDTF